MPTYTYRCQTCGHQFDIFQKFADNPLTECPECHGALKKVLHPVGVVFKGSGWYITDSRPSQSSEGGEKSEKSDKSDKDDAAKSGSSDKAAATKETSSGESAKKSEAAGATSAKSETKSKAAASTES